MYWKDKLYPELDYFIRKKSDYVLDICLTEINNFLFLFCLWLSPTIKSKTIIYLFSMARLKFHLKEKSYFVPGVRDAAIIFYCQVLMMFYTYTLTQPLHHFPVISAPQLSSSFRQNTKIHYLCQAELPSWWPLSQTVDEQVRTLNNQQPNQALVVSRMQTRSRFNLCEWLR
jgi:hypothetical protein